MASAGLESRTRYAAPVLMIAANVADLDALVFATGASGVAFRRGWTHGVLAQAVLPLVLTAAVAVLARMRRATPAAGTRGVPFSVPWVLGLSYLGVLSHVGMDYLNNYGVRLLVPFDWRWFYGDAVFIIDVWLWAALGAGIWLTRRTGRAEPSRAALAFTVAYVVLMLLSARVSTDIVRETWQATWGETPEALMVGPLPVTPFTREIIVDLGDRYQAGTFSWMTQGIRVSPRSVPKNDRAPEVAQARGSPAIRGFLVWSRFPYWEIEQTGAVRRVTVRDMRFGGRFSASTVLPPDP